MKKGLLYNLLGLFGYSSDQSKKGQSDKMAFAKELIRRQEEERKRIPRELNDGVGDTISFLRKEIEKTTEIALENQRLIRSALEEVRSIARTVELF